MSMTAPGTIGPGVNRTFEAGAPPFGSGPAVVAPLTLTAPSPAVTPLTIATAPGQTADALDINFPSGAPFLQVQALTNGGSLTLNGTPTAAAYMQFFGPSTAATQLGINWYDGAAQIWTLYMITQDDTLYFRDQVDGRMHMYLLHGANSQSAVTNLASVLNLSGDGTHVYSLRPGVAGAGIFDIADTGAGIGWMTFNGNTGFITAGTVYGIQLGASAPALNSTGGPYPYIPATPGAPTGVPISAAGYVPMRYDTTNHKLWIYDAGWKGVVVA